MANAKKKFPITTQPSITVKIEKIANKDKQTVMIMAGNK